MDALDFKTKFIIYARYFLICLSAASLVSIYWSFIGAFTNKKWLKILIVGLMIAGSAFWYYEMQKPVEYIQMKEDVLYIHPKK